MEMGSPDDYPKKASPHQQRSSKLFKLKILLLVILSNLLTFYIFAGSGPPTIDHIRDLSHFSIPWPNTTALSEELRSTRDQLTATRSQLTNLHQRLLAVGGILTQRPDYRQGDEIADVLASLPNEAKLALGPHMLPLGYSFRSGSNVIYPSVGLACLQHKDELIQYMKYEIGRECPVDDVFTQRLLLKGCEPLPRRRCRPRSPKGYVDPTPFPQSLWRLPSDTSIVWEPYTCKSYKCLVDRGKDPRFFDCKDCFDLNGREKSRWLIDHGGLDYSIDYVLKRKRLGTIRIGLDLGGGPGTFAARMRERNVTIITTSMNLDGPFNSFIASRGLIPMHMSVSQRLPFFENTLDIVHSMHMLSNWIPDAMLEFTFYDIYRVLRPGGLFWLDHFFCTGPQLNQTYVPMIDRVGFKRIRWNAGLKLDKKKDEWYFSALLEKPMS